MPVLDEIVARKCVDVARRMERTPLSHWQERAALTERRFGEALKRPGARFIMECKKASPSAGLIRENFDMREIAAAYRGFADAVSVLTDEPYFQGSLENLRIARELLDVPILCKDFVVSPYQVYEARAHGADAVLLMLSVLNDETYRECLRAASELAMDVLTEVHDEGELKRALAMGARIVGINNRDLKTMQVDLRTTARLAEKIRQTSGRRKPVVVCESGIDSHRDVMGLSRCADAFLVGSRLMKQARLDLAVRELLFGRVKICGLTSAEDAAWAYESGASFGGLIFAAESPRCVGEDQAKEIAQASPLPLVGVFVNEAAGRAAQIAGELGLAAVQLHGEETAAYGESLRKELPADCEIWKAARVRQRQDIADLGAYPADRLLLDTFARSARGGTGNSFDWALLDDMEDRSRIILAGGIGPGNACRAMGLGTYAVDVNSGVEYPGAPGKKDQGAIRELFGNLRNIS